MAGKFDFIRRIIPEMVEDASKTKYNKAAIDALRKNADEEARLAQELASMDKGQFGNTINLDPNDFKSLPATAETGFDLVGSPQTKDFVLGEASDISRAPVPFKAPQTEAPKNLPGFPIDQPDGAALYNKSGFSDRVQNLNKQKAALIALGGGSALGLTGTSNLTLDINQPLDQAASMAPKVPEPDIAPAALAQLTPEVAEVPKSETEKALERLQGRGMASRGPSIRDIDFGANTSASMEGLKDAQERSRQATLGATLGRIGAAFATGASGTRNNFDEMNAANVRAAEAIPEQYLKQVQFEKEDPNSAMSQGYRQIAQAMGFNIKGQASAADLERIIPQMSNIYNQEQARIARSEDNALRLAMAKDARKEKTDARGEEKKNQFIEKAQKVTSKEFEKLQKVENAFDMIDQAQDDKVGAADVAILYNFIKSQDPESVVREGEIALGQRGMALAGRLRAATLGQFTGEILDPKFRKDVLKIARRLKDQGYNSYDQAVNTIRDTARQRYGMSEDELTLIDPVMNREKRKQSGDKQDPKVEAYAKQYGLDYNQALGILKARGYNAR